ncbi:hypothetical protein O3P69_005309 [Scylla paramamosain]|uniref:Uncharacterized protein n=1 Tax=Scylla paramamosain TaxID=85552 RepID=A0AAW0U8Q9_SCYPA
MEGEVEEEQEEQEKEVSQDDLTMPRYSHLHLLNLLPRLLLLRALWLYPGASGQQRQAEGRTTTTTTTTTTTPRPPGNATRGWEGTWSGYTDQDYRKEIFPPVTPVHVSLNGALSLTQRPAHNISSAHPPQPRP